MASPPPPPQQAPPAARLVVVDPTPADNGEPVTRQVRRRQAQQVLAGTALRVAGEQMRAAGVVLLLVLAGEWLLARLFASPLPPWPWLLGTAALATALVARWPRAPKGREELLLTGWVALATLALALPPWLGDARAALAWLPLAGAGALALAAALGPHRRSSLLASAGPLLAALPGGTLAALLGLLVSVLALLLGTHLRQRWQRTMLHLLEQADRLRELQAERDQALRADADKSRFLAIASHDLRQPVHALGLFAATLHKRLQASPDEALARNLMRSVDGLERSFNAMLDISRLDGGAVSPRPQNFPLRDVFRRLHMQFGGQAELAGLALRFSPGGKSVTSDPQLLERIVGNLVQNALRYTAHGGVVVVARHTRTHVNIEIWDTGCGIAAADLPRIFEEFFQVGRSERDRSQGLGMGLAIVKRLAALLGHRLEVASRPGRGTMFRLGVPVGSLDGMDHETAAADTQPMEPAAEAPRMVLVVDDEEPIREGLRLLLQEWGYQVMTAADGAQAEQAVAALEGRVDLILSDLHLGPGPGGHEVVASVRRLCGRALPAVLVTGDTTGEALREVAAGADPVLFKPVQPRHLLEALRNAFGQRADGA